MVSSPSSPLEHEFLRMRLTYIRKWPTEKILLVENARLLAAYGRFWRRTKPVETHGCIESKECIIILYWSYLKELVAAGEGREAPNRSVFKHICLWAVKM